MPGGQDPFVEVIRFGMTHRAVGYYQRGDVEQVQDRILHKSVFRIRGSVAATNYLRVPRDAPKGTQGLGLAGRYVYLQLRQVSSLPCTIHLDYATNKKTMLRVTLSTMFTAMRSTGAVLRVPLRPTAQWTVLVLDMLMLLKCHAFNQYSREEYHHLAAVTLCSNMNVRNVIVSPTRYTPETMPSTLQLRIDDYAWEHLPPDDGLPTPTQRYSSMKENISRPPSTPKEAIVPPYQRRGENQVSDPSRAFTHGTTQNSDMLHDRHEVLSKADQILRQAGIFEQPRHNALSVDLHPGPHSHAITSPPAKPKPPKSRLMSSTTQRDWPDPVLHLERIIGFSSNATETLLWLPNGSAFIYASYSTIIIRYTNDHAAASQLADISDGDLNLHHIGYSSVSNEATSDQQFLLGHSGSISAMALTEDGSVLASAEVKKDSNPCSVRLWDLARCECLIVIKAHSREVTSVCFSSDTTQRHGLLLCGVGFDDNGRTQILVWDCSELRRGISATEKPRSAARRAAVTMIARQTSDFPVKSISFSPYEHEFPCLISCGRENVRYWRVARSGHIVGHPVILKEYSRGTVFNSIGFDALCESFPSDMRRLRPVYAASSIGTLLVIDYDSREVVCVYQLHDASINCLVINEGFCVTGSDDRVLRVWPLDFTDFFLEAHHDAPVTAADVSSDGMKVLVGSRNSAVGVLDISSQVYKTVLRSHSQPVIASELLPWCASAIDQAINRRKDELMTGSSDGTLRIWDVRSGDQLYEFDVQHDHVTCIEPAPLDQGVVAVGFASGCCRIFDVRQLGSGEEDSTVSENANVVVAEMQQHKSAILHLKFTRDGSFLYSSGAGKQLCMYSVTPQREFIPVKMLILGFNPLDGRLSISHDDKYLSVITADSGGVLLLQCDSLRLHCTIAPPKPTSAAILATELKLAEFCRDQLLLLSKTDRLHIYAMGSRQFVRTMTLLGQDGGVTAMTTSANLKYMATGGADGSLRVWQMGISGKVERLFQSFLGQTGAVIRLTFTASGNQLLATSESSTVFAWRFLGDSSMAPLPPIVPDHPPFGSPVSMEVGEDEKENNMHFVDSSNQDEAKEGGSAMDVVEIKGVNAAGSNPLEETISPSLDVPIPTLKPHLHLALGKESLVLGSAPSEASVTRTIDEYDNEAQVSPIPTSAMTLSADERVALRLSNVISGYNPDHMAWSFALGKLVYVMGSTVWVEDLAAESTEVREESPLTSDSEQTDLGLRHDDSSPEEIALLQLSPGGGLAATVSSSYRHFNIHCLREHSDDCALCRGSQGRCRRIRLIPDINRIHSLAFSCGPGIDEDMICFSSSMSGGSHHVVSIASLSAGAIVWSKETSEPRTQVGSILPLVSRDSFLLFSTGEADPSSGLLTGGARLEALDVEHIHGEFSDAQVSVIIERFPLDVQRVALSQDVSRGDPRYQQHLIGIDKDMYCCFFDLEADAFVATTQLLPAYSRTRGSESSKLSSVQVMAWSGSRNKQSLIVTGSVHETFVCVHALPMKSTKFSARAQIDWQRVARSAVSLTHTIALPGGALRSLSIDPSRGVGVVMTSEACVSIIDLDTQETGGSTRVLRRVEHDSSLSSRLRSLSVGQPNSGASTGVLRVADIGWAVKDSLLLSRSVDCGALRAWLPDVAREVIRFDAASTMAAPVCTCFTVHRFCPLAMLGYDDNALRIVNVCTGQLLAYFHLAFDRHATSLPTDRAEQARGLRTLRQREKLRGSSPLKTPAVSSNGEQRASTTLKQLEFVGRSSTALAVTSDQRLFWIDYASAVAKDESSPAFDARAAKAAAKSSKAAMNEVVYQEIVLSESKFRRQSRASRRAVVRVTVESISVRNDALGSQDGRAAAARIARGRSAGVDAAFLVVLRSEYADGRVLFDIKVYADPSMRMLSEDAVLPSDEWRVASATRQPPLALFLPPSDPTHASTKVLYSTAARSSDQGDAGELGSDMEARTARWQLEVRDCRERTVLRRFVMDACIAAPVRMAILPSSAIEGATAVSGASTDGRFVLLVDDHSGMALVDLMRLAVLPIDTQVARRLKLQLLSSKAIGATSGKLVLDESFARANAD